MSCCGAGRQQVRTAILAAPKPPNGGGGVTIAHQRQVDFEYTGDATLTAIGPVTGRSYRFAGAGATLVVDARDAAGMLQVPKLRKLQRR